MLANQIECFRLEQISVIKFLLAEKCKSYEIYRRIYDVKREAYFREKNVYKLTKYEFATMRQSQNNRTWIGNTLTLQ